MTNNFILPSPDGYPTRQASHSTTFKVPPLDGSMTMLGMFDWHLENNPDHPLFLYKSSHTTHVQSILWPDATRAIHRCARLIRASIEHLTPGRSFNRASPPVIAVLGHLGEFA